MKKLSERELDHKIDKFLRRKNAEVFHSQTKVYDVDINRRNNTAMIRFA